MKKIILLLISLFILTNVYADDIKLEEYTLENCSSINAIFLKDSNNKTVRIGLLAYDSMDGNLNKEIENYICNKLTNAKTIGIEIDPKMKKEDDYNRKLVWLFIDNELLQRDLIEKGYGQVNYILDEYQYLDSLCEAEEKAVKNKLGVWNYPDVEEAFCDSNYKSEKGEEKNGNGLQKVDITKDELKKVLFFNSLLILLIIALYLKRGHYEKTK